MSIKSGLLVTAVAGFLFLNDAARAQQTSANQPVIPGPGWHFGEVIDGSTADDARRKIEAAGFTECAP